MFISWRDVLAQEQHIEEIRREAAAERLANQCLVQRDVTVRFYWRWLAQLGSWLVEVGCRLQTHAGSRPRLVYLTGVDRTTRPC